MSEIKVNSIKGVGASTAAITVNNTDGTCTANITSINGGSIGTKNLIINGAMQVAQRGTSGSKANGYPSIDRFYTFSFGLDESPTMSQGSLTSSDTPYSSGFRKYLRFQNGNQTGGAATGDQTQFKQAIEGQNVANSGWNYTSSSSFITLSFWIRASVAQTYYGFLKASDGGNYVYPFSIALSANTWTKVTKSIPGNSNLQIDDDTGNGLEFGIYPFLGTSYTDNSVSLDAWSVYNGSQRTPDYTTTWYTTNDSTIDITGVQLEVGSVATEFEHRSFAQELALCQRYYQVIVRASDYGSGIAPICNVIAWQTNNVFGVVNLPVSMRSSPSLDAVSGTGYWLCLRNAGSGSFNSILLASVTNSRVELNFYAVSSGTTIDANQPAWMRTNDSSAFIGLQAEL